MVKKIFIEARNKRIKTKDVKSIKAFLEELLYYKKSITLQEAEYPIKGFRAVRFEVDDWEVIPTIKKLFDFLNELDGTNLSLAPGEHVTIFCKNFYLTVYDGMMSQRINI